MKSLLWPSVSLVVLLALGSGCKEPEPPKLITQVSVVVDVLDTCSKVVKLKDSFFLRPDSVVELAYSWTTAQDFAVLSKDYSVWAHFETDSGELLWIEDHLPSPRILDWKPGTTYTYTDLIQIPAKLADPRVALYVGLYDRKQAEDRLYLPDPEAKPVKKLKVAQFFIQPEERELYAEGWGRLEYGEDGATSWRWFTTRAKYSFRNPMKYCFLTVKGSTLLECFPEAPSLTIQLNNQELEQFLMDTSVFAGHYEIPPEVLGAGDWCDLVFLLDKSFTPASCQQSTDTRILGMMIDRIEVAEMAFLDGWYNPEVTLNASWRWCGTEGLIRTGNPRADARIAIDGEVNFEALKTAPLLQTWVGEHKVDEFTPDSDRVNRVIKVGQELWGTAETSEIMLTTNQIFKPKDVFPGATDDRELGIRIKAVRIIPTP